MSRILLVPCQFSKVQSNIGQEYVFFVKEFPHSAGSSGRDGGGHQEVQRLQHKGEDVGGFTSVDHKVDVQFVEVHVV